MTDWGLVLPLLECQGRNTARLWLIAPRDSREGEHQVAERVGLVAKEADQPPT